MNNLAAQIANPSDEELRKKLGATALNLIKENSGTTAKVIEHIKTITDKTF